MVRQDTAIIWYLIKRIWPEKDVKVSLLTVFNWTSFNTLLRFFTTGDISMQYNLFQSNSFPVRANLSCQRGWLFMISHWQYYQQFLKNVGYWLISEILATESRHQYCRMDETLGVTTAKRWNKLIPGNTSITDIVTQFNRKWRVSLTWSEKTLDPAEC